MLLENELLNPAIGEVGANKFSPLSISKKKKTLPPDFSLFSKMSTLLRNILENFDLNSRDYGEV